MENRLRSRVIGASNKAARRIPRADRSVVRACDRQPAGTDSELIGEQPGSAAQWTPRTAFKNPTSARHQGRSSPSRNPGRRNIRTAARQRSRKIPGGCCVQPCSPNYAQPRLSRDGRAGADNAGRGGAVRVAEMRQFGARPSPAGREPGCGSGRHRSRRRTGASESRQRTGQRREHADDQPSWPTGRAVKVTIDSPRQTLVTVPTAGGPALAFGSAATDTRCHVNVPEGSSCPKPMGGEFSSRCRGRTAATPTPAGCDSATPANR
jgi:hypothetical protein